MVEVVFEADEVSNEGAGGGWMGGGFICQKEVGDGAGHGGFGADDAVGAPDTVGDFADEGGLVGVGGFHAGADFSVEVVEFAFAFFEVGGVDDDGTGIDAVPDAVHGAFSFALGGFRPG